MGIEFAHLYNEPALFIFCDQGSRPTSPAPASTSGASVPPAPENPATAATKGADVPPKDSSVENQADPVPPVVDNETNETTRVMPAENQLLAQTESTLTSAQPSEELRGTESDDTNRSPNKLLLSTEKEEVAGHSTITIDSSLKRTPQLLLVSWLCVAHLRVIGVYNLLLTHSQTH